MRVDTKQFSVAVYHKGDRVCGVWFDDPVGRNDPKSIDEKVLLYLTRYGALANWELRMDNGWMRYWFNPADRVAMVYGIHNDVIRFNQYEEPTLWQS